MMTPIRFIVFVGILFAMGVFNGGCIGQRPTDSPENEARLKALEMKVERLERMAATTANPAVPAEKSVQPSTSPASLDIKKMELEVETHYAKADPEIREYVIWTAKTFGRHGMWLNEDAFAALPANAREERIQHLVTLLNGEYGRQLCSGLAEASALKDKRLLPGLIKVAGYQKDNVDYDCRPKWMAIAALARQESDEAMPLLVSLVDHGNQNTRNWARAALSRKTGQDVKQDKQAWAKWWQEQGNKPIDDQLLKPWVMPPQNKK